MSNKEEKDDVLVYIIGTRTLSICGEINEKIIDIACNKLQEIIVNIINENKVLKDAEIGHINLWINSPGGTVADMWALIDMMMTSPIPIYTFVRGEACSAACGIFLAGACRYILPNATLMYHQLSAGVTGNFQDMAERVAAIEVEQKKFEAFVQTRTCLKPKEIAEIRDKKKDYYMTAEQAKKLNFATDIFSCKDWGLLANG